VSFYTTELPEYMLVVLTGGLLTWLVIDRGRLDQPGPRQRPAPVVSLQ
jgi:hypothetical protein